MRSSASTYGVGGFGGYPGTKFTTASAGGVSVGGERSRTSPFSGLQSLPRLSDQFTQASAALQQHESASPPQKAEGNTAATTAEPPYSPTLPHQHGIIDRCSPNHGNGNAAVGGTLGLLRARDTGNSPSRSRMATPLSSSFREFPTTPPVIQQQFSATNLFSNASALPRSAGGVKRLVSRGGTASSYDASLLYGLSPSSSVNSALSGMAHGVSSTNPFLIPPLYVPPIEQSMVTSPVPHPNSNSEGCDQVLASPTSPVPVSGPPPPLANRAAVTVIFDLDETLCNNRRPGKALLRPHALELLHHLNGLRNDPSVNCYVEIILWTASMECVARPVVERLDPAGTLFQHLIYRDRRWYKETGYTKDLRRLGREMHHTVIVENSPASVHLNRKHSLLVRDFVSGTDHDLLAVKEILDGWIRAAGQCARSLGAPPPNEATSPSSIVRYLSEHPYVNSGNEVVNHAYLNKPPTTASGEKTNGYASTMGTRSSLGLSVTRFSVNRPSFIPGRR